MTSKFNKGERTKIRRDNLLHVLMRDKQKEDIKKYENSQNFHAEIESRNGKKRCNIKFDDFSVDDKIVCVRRQKIIAVIEEVEEEVEYDHINDDLTPNKVHQRKMDIKNAS